jgi:transcriptional regulator GlxA family with amidase domain
MGNATTDSRVRTVLGLLEAGWNGPIRLSELASRAGIGQSRLEHLFKAQVGCCVREYVGRRRLDHAARLLVKTRLPIKEVARRVGISDRCNFNHAFRKRFGLSPRAFRNAHVVEVLRPVERPDHELQAVS